jgi:hypothetical protein
MCSSTMERMPQYDEFSSSYLRGFVSVLQAFDVAALDGVIARVSAAYRDGRQLFVAGNGGSAATASHMAADLGKTVLGKRIDPRAPTPEDKARERKQISRGKLAQKRADEQFGLP